MIPIAMQLAAIRREKTIFDAGRTKTSSIYARARPLRAARQINSMLIGDGFQPADKDNEVYERMQQT